MKNNRTGRIMQLLTMLQSQRGYKISELVGMLGKSRRTVYRDLKELERAGLPCRFDTRRHGYALELKSPLLTIALSKEEAFGLLLLLREADQNIRLPFTYSARLLSLKIENCLRQEVRQCCDESFRFISISHAPKTRMDLLDKTFMQVLEAIQVKRVLAIHCYLSAEQNTIITDLNPYYLVYSENTWHAIGESSFHKTVHTFKLNQIKQLNPLDRYFVEDEKFDLREYFGYAWSLLREGQIYEVELRFGPGIAADVAEVQWHETQTASFEEDGSVVLKFRVDGLNEITWWVLGYGDQVEVLAPKALRQRIAQIASRIAASQLDDAVIS
jgi:predicted DNA-binding transcriptional regulator YafY